MYVLHSFNFNTAKKFILAQSKIYEEILIEEAKKKHFAINKIMKTNGKIATVQEIVDSGKYLFI